MISSATSAATQGMIQNLQNLTQAAQGVADPTSGVDPSSLVALKVAEHGVKVNAAVANAVYESTEYLLDILV